MQLADNKNINPATLALAQAIVNNASVAESSQDKNGTIPTMLPEGYAVEGGKQLYEAGEDDFIVNDKGEKNLWNLSKLKEQTNGVLDNLPVRLQAGNKGHGYRHLVFRHIDEIKGKGFKNAFEYIDYIMANYNQVYDQSNVEHAHRYAFYVKDDKRGFMPVDLEIKKDGNNYYTIVTVMPHKAKIKGTLLYNGSARPSTTTTSSPLSVESTENGGDASTIVNAKTNVPSVDNSITQTDENIKENNNENDKNEHNQVQHKQPEGSQQKEGKAGQGAENQTDKVTGEETSNAGAKFKWGRGYSGDLVRFGTITLANGDKQNVSVRSNIEGQDGGTTYTVTVSDSKKQCCLHG